MNVFHLRHMNRYRQFELLSNFQTLSANFATASILPFLSLKDSLVVCSVSDFVLMNFNRKISTRKKNQRVSWIKLRITRIVNFYWPHKYKCRSCFSAFHTFGIPLGMNLLLGSFRTLYEWIMSRECCFLPYFLSKNRSNCECFARSNRKTEQHSSFYSIISDEHPVLEQSLIGKVQNNWEVDIEPDENVKRHRMNGEK